LSVDEAIERFGHDRVIAALVGFLSDKRRERIEEILEKRLRSVTVALVDLYDPHNGAAAIRTAEAFGLADVHAVEGTEDFSYSKGITIGCDQWMRLHKHASFEACAAGLRGQGMRLVATHLDATKTMDDLDPTQPHALVFGNEHDGLSDEVVANCDDVVRIPMYGFTQSFNLSVSVALLLQPAVEARRRVIEGRGDLSEAEKLDLRTRWYGFSVRAVDQILDRHFSELENEGH